MLKPLAFATALFVGFVALSMFAGRATRGSITGTVTEFKAGEWIAVASEQTDPGGFRITLREATSYEGNPADIEAGVRVTIWYRSVGERRLVSDKVRVLPLAARR